MHQAYPAPDSGESVELRSRDHFAGSQNAVQTENRSEKAKWPRTRSDLRRGLDMPSGFIQYGLMAVFFGVIIFIPAAWIALGLKSYGTGDYHQP